jgi:hypothetical protein
MFVSEDFYRAVSMCYHDKTMPKKIISGKEPL